MNTGHERLWVRGVGHKGVWSWVIACAITLAPAVASAGLYKFEQVDGSVLVTTEWRSDLKLIEVIDGSPPAASATTRSSPSSKKAPNPPKPGGKRSRNIARAHDAREAHIDENGHLVKEEVADLSYSERTGAYDDLIEEASEAYDVPFAFIKGVIRVESNFNPHAISSAGAQGLMQLMPSTASGLGVRDPFDPRENVFGGAKLLRNLINRYDGDINLVLAAYNVGGVAVRKYDGIPYARTRSYVANVYKWYRYYSAREGAASN